MTAEAVVRATHTRIREAPWDVLPSIRPELLAALEFVLSGQAAETTLDRLLRAHRDWSSEQRRMAAEALFGVGLWRRRLAHLAGEPGAAALLDTYVRDLAGTPAPFSDFPDWPTALSWPEWLADHVRTELLGNDSEAMALCATMNLKGPITARINPLLTTRDALRAELTAQGLQTTAATHSPLAFHFDTRPNVLGLPAHREGRFEIQDEGSQLLGLLLQAKPDESVLDLCAGAGGKTLLLAAEMENRGLLYAFDTDLKKVGRLEQRTRQARVTNVRPLYALPPTLRCDRIFVDAPCSALGVLRRGPDVRFRIAPETLTALLEVQAGLLDTAARHLHERGRIVYATCTLNRAENEAQVEAFLGRHPDFHPIAPAGVPADTTDGLAFRCLPHRHGTDGFYAAVLERDLSSRSDAAPIPMR